MSEPGDPIAAYYRRVNELTPRVWATPLLIAVNLLVYAMLVARGQNWLAPSAQSMIEVGANFRPLIKAEPWRLLTAVFLHYGLIHVGLNMIVLWQIGRVVERLLGNVGFLLLYLTAGLLSSLVSVVFHQSVVSAGASGAVFGVYGLFLGCLLRSRGEVPRAVWKHQLGGALVFVVYNVGFGMLPGIDQAAHLGGLAAGFLMGLVAAVPLTPEARGRRLPRAALVAIAGVALTAVALSLLPPVVSWKAENQPLMDFEARANALFQQYEVGKLSDEELTSEMRRKILPEWRVLRERLGALPDPPAGMVKNLQSMDAKMDALTRFIGGIETGTGGAPNRRQ